VGEACIESAERVSYRPSPSPNQPGQLNLIFIDRIALLVEKAPAESNGALETPVLVERNERLRVSLEPAATFRGLPVAQIRVQDLLVTKRAADSARSSNEQAGRDLESGLFMATSRLGVWIPSALQ